MSSNQSLPMASMHARVSDSVDTFRSPVRRLDDKLSRDEALAPVPAHNHRSHYDYEAWEAPLNSGPAGLWYAQARAVWDMPIDDCVWFVLPDGSIRRGIPVGNPIHEPSALGLDG